MFNIIQLRHTFVNDFLTFQEVWFLKDDIHNLQGRHHFKLWLE